MDWLNRVRSLQTCKYDPAVGTFKGWLLQITRRRIAEQFGKREKAFAAHQATHACLQGRDDERTDTAARLMAPESLHLEEVFEQEWRQSLFQAALGRVRSRVSPKQFQMFDLVVTQQWPMKLVTGTLGANRTAPRFTWPR